MKSKTSFSVPFALQSWSVLLALLCLRASAAAEFKFPNHTFTLPDGFEIEQVAGPPLVDRPIGADFDEWGRLYVTDSSGSNDKVDKQLQDKPHRIVRLEDTDGDGKFDKSVVFADKMMFPEGVLWFDGAVYSGAPPTIWKLEDTDGDGVADKRTEWHQGKTLTGCANDLHGPYLGPDGWIYWCKGAFAKQTYERPGRPTISDSAAHIFRCRPDGSEFDSLMSGGMDNPVEIAFTPEGEAVFTTTFYSHPQSGQRDALVHAIYGGVYPKTHGVLDGLKRTGELLPPLTHLGPAVPSGLMRYASRAFGDDFEGNLFSTQFNLRKIQRHILEPFGSTFRTRDIDFLVSDNHEFHPTDVLEDADGSLLVVDTGGWYKLCCPSSQIAKPQVLGAIYRIRRAGAPKISDPRGLKLAWASLKPSALLRLLEARRPAVQKRAVAQLAKLGERSIPDLKRAVEKGIRPANQARLRRASALSVETRRNAVWALTRIDGSPAREAVRLALSDVDASVQQAAVHSVGMHRDGSAVLRLIEMLKSSPPHLQRNAATALGRIGGKSAVPVLLEQASTPRDRMLEHSLIYALIEIGDREGTAAGLNAASAYTRRAALIALDQMNGGKLQPGDVIPHLTSSDSVLKETASWIASLHPEWAGELAGLYQQWLSEKNLNDRRREELKRQFAQFARNTAMQQFVADALHSSQAPAENRLLVLHAMASAPLRDTPKPWITELRRCFSDADQRVVRQSIATIRALPVVKTNAAELTESLLALARDEHRDSELRLNALSALPSALSPVEPAVFDFLRASLSSARPPVERTMAASVLGRAKLDDVQLLALTESLKSAGPLELSRLLSAFEKGTNEASGLRLVAALKDSKGSAGLRVDLLRQVLARFPASVQKAGDELCQSLNVDLAQQIARLDQLQSHLNGGDRDRGRRIFESTKTACSTCHQVGYLGGKIGPDLTRIGSVRTERDLLEAILYPNASFVRSYEPMVVVTKNGDEYSGVLRQETSDSIVLVSGAGAEQRLAMADVAELRPSAVSVMPGGLEEQLSKQEMADLIAFLKSLK